MVSPQSDSLQFRHYSLRWNPRPNLVGWYAVLCSVLSGLSIVISWLAVLTIPGGFIGIGALYFASVFYAVITYWFGGWGLIASFIGAFIGSGVLTGMPVVFALPFAIADIIEPLVPFLLLRGLGVRIGLNPLGANLASRPRNMLLFIVFGAALPPFLSGLWGVSILRLARIVPNDAFLVALGSWWLGATILLALFVPPICRGLGGWLDRSGRACLGIWS
jgi:integral membrane sensor domain MASE1